jgi:hypothetical protein
MPGLAMVVMCATCVVDEAPPERVAQITVSDPEDELHAEPPHVQPPHVQRAVDDSALLPEPMNFDLIRPLGARRGELESNVLVTMRRRRDGGLAPLAWAPEVEWAIIDNFAVELELPMTNLQLESLKAAAQWTAPSPSPRFQHGIQVIYERFLHESTTEATALYLAGRRFGALSLFAMAGGRLGTGVMGHTEVLLNPSAFVDVHRDVILGVEANAAIATTGGRDLAQILGQVHWQVARRLRVQVGGGVTREDGQLGGLVVSRWIVD